MNNSEDATGQRHLKAQDQPTQGKGTAGLAQHCVVLMIPMLTLARDITTEPDCGRTTDPAVNFVSNPDPDNAMALGDSAGHSDQDVLGAISLQIYAEVSESRLMWILRLHHTVIYIFYGLLGVTRILSTTIKSLPVSLTKLALSSAFLVQTFIMYNHTHGRVTVDVYLHKILALATFLSGLVSFMEVLTKNNITLEMLRSSLIMLQGTWLWQMGFVLYNPTGGIEWDLTDHHNTMLLTIYFCFHCVFAYIIIGVNYAVVTWLVKWRLRKFYFTQVPLLKNVGQEEESEEM
ncbi:transmembrane protein 45A-like [Onychomys torridus]|uniref:transmembrane protein 45A-like n=1 Tax=Onychomys torridus TaxID=38674 RepID=UPI00167FA1C6|nr:transmembrane protein 45A-like [Onychomys torridus]